MTKEKFYDTAMVALGCFIGLVVIVLLALGYSANKTNEQLKEMESNSFYNKCAAACAPNAVYSTKYNRCECNAMVVVREVK
jgi:hypothetical protein